MKIGCTEMFCILMTVVFGTAKVLGFLTWSWPVVFAPMIAYGCVLCLLILAVGFFYILGEMLEL
jgi:hypothetical protein